MKINIKMFGALRAAGDSRQVEVRPDISVAQLKESIAAQMPEIDRDLIADCVLATESEILPEAYILRDVQELSLLPPVCGG